MEQTELDSGIQNLSFEDFPEDNVLSDFIASCDESSQEAAPDPVRSIAGPSRPRSPSPQWQHQDLQLSQEDQAALATQLDFEDTGNYEWGDDDYQGWESEEEVADEEEQVEDEDEETEGQAGGRVQKENMAMTPGQFLASRIPTTTRKANEAAVRLFNLWTCEYNREFQATWCENIEGVHDEDLPWHLAAWLQGLLMPTGEQYNASSLVTYCNAMARHLRQTRHIDIKRDPNFYDFQQILKARQLDSASEGKLPGKNAMLPLSKTDLEQAWRAGALGLGDPRAAGATMIMNLIGMCGFRSVEEVYMTRNDDFKLSLSSTEGVADYIEVSERISKMRRGFKGGMRLLQPKLFAYHAKPARWIYTCLLNQ